MVDTTFQTQEQKEARFQSSFPNAIIKNAISNNDKYVHRFEFKASNGMLKQRAFKDVLWLIFTLGLYNFFIGASQKKFLYQHTFFKNQAFDFRFKKRHLALGIIMIYIASFIYAEMSKAESIISSIASILLLYIGTTWLNFQRIRNGFLRTYFNGHSFIFDGKFKEYIRLVIKEIYLFWNIPLMSYRDHHFQVKYLSHQGIGFKSSATKKDFYQFYLKKWLLVVMEICITVLFLGLAIYFLMKILSPSFAELLSLLSISNTTSSPLTTITLYIFAFILFILFIPLIITIIYQFFLIFSAHYQNFIAKHIQYGDHHFSSDIDMKAAYFLAFKNITLCMITFGLYGSMAKFKFHKMRVEGLCFHQNSALPNKPDANENNKNPITLFIDDL